MSAPGPGALSAALSAVGLWMGVGALLAWLMGSGNGYAWTWILIIAGGLAAYMLLLVHVLLDIKGEAPPPGRTHSDELASGKGTASPERPQRFTVVLAVTVVILVAGITTRTLWPGSAPLLFGLAPLVVLVVPGLGLGIALLNRRSLIEHILQAVPLSIGSLLVVVMWLDLLGVKNSLPLMMVCGLMLTSLGFLSAWRDR